MNVTLSNCADGSPTSRKGAPRARVAFMEDANSSVGVIALSSKQNQKLAGSGDNQHRLSFQRGSIARSVSPVASQPGDQVDGASTRKSLVAEARASRVSARRSRAMSREPPSSRAASRDPSRERAMSAVSSNMAETRSRMKSIVMPAAPLIISKQVFDDIMDDLESGLSKIEDPDIKASMVKLSKAELDFLKNIEMARDFLNQVLDCPTRDDLFEIFCEKKCIRICRARAVVEVAQFSNMNAKDPRPQNFLRACEMVEKVLISEFGCEEELKTTLEQQRRLHNRKVAALKKLQMVSWSMASLAASIHKTRRAEAEAETRPQTCPKAPAGQKSSAPAASPEPEAQTLEQLSAVDQDQRPSGVGEEADRHASSSSMSQALSANQYEEDFLGRRIPIARAGSENVHSTSKPTATLDEPSQEADPAATGACARELGDGTASGTLTATPTPAPAPSGPAADNASGSAEASGAAGAASTAGTSPTVEAADAGHAAGAEAASNAAQSTPCTGSKPLKEPVALSSSTSPPTASSGVPLPTETTSSASSTAGAAAVAASTPTSAAAAAGPASATPAEAATCNLGAGAKAKAKAAPENPELIEPAPAQAAAETDGAIPASSCKTEAPESSQPSPSDSPGDKVPAAADSNPSGESPNSAPEKESDHHQADYSKSSASTSTSTVSPSASTSTEGMAASTASPSLSPSPPPTPSPNSSPSPSPSASAADSAPGAKEASPAPGDARSLSGANAGGLAASSAEIDEENSKLLDPEASHDAEDLDGEEEENEIEEEEYRLVWKPQPSRAWCELICCCRHAEGGRRIKFQVD